MVRFNADHYFHIGSTHYSSGKPCQDYSLSGANETVACAIVSDGCSTGRHTDVGSRVLALSTLQAIRDHVKASGGALNTAVVSITSRQQQIIGTTRLILGLERIDMLATCGYVYLTQHGGFAHIQGDGVFAMKYKDGSILMSMYEWAKNTPFYPSYGDGDLDKFVEVHGGDLEAKRLTCTTVFQKPDGTYNELGVKEYTLREGLLGVLFDISESDMNQLEFVAVFSDGVAQIDHINWKTAVSEFLAFKNANGYFAKRRMIRGIKDMQKIGVGPTDDISFAVIRIENIEIEEEKK